MQRIERGFTARLTRFLQKAANDAAQAVETYGASANIEAALQWMDGELQAIMISQYTAAAEIFGSRILNAFKSHAGYQTKATDTFKESMELWIRKKAADKVAEINDTTKKRIRSEINEGFASSLPASTVSQNIVTATGGAIAKSRATVISRTETHMAAQQASVEAFKSTGVQGKKVWVSAEDERTRETHSQADSDSHANPLDVRDDFIVGGDSMSAPGLGSDPAENVNCRCQCAFIVE